MDTNIEIRPKVGVGLVIAQNKKVLLGKRKGAHGEGQWAFPGGHLEFGESVEECARRELEEETGLKAVSMEMGTWTNDMIDQEKHYITLWVYIKSFEGELQLKEPHKCEEWKWFEWKALPSPIFTTIHSLIKKVGIEKFENFLFLDTQLI